MEIKSAEDRSGVEHAFPIEFFITDRVPVSLAGSARSKERWQETIRDSALMAIESGSWATDQPVTVTIFYFADGPMKGDIDNIVKLILDAMKQLIYMDDTQVERLVVQKFEPGRPSLIAEGVSETLASALDFDPPVLYVRIDVDGSAL